MKYRIDPRTGNKLSALGVGCMRFSRNISARIDIGRAEKLVMSAIDRGVNYFDTAYIYPGSERALGEVLRRNEGARERIHIATKLPLGHCGSFSDFDRLFDTQLKRLGTGYIDYYLIHNVSSMAQWERIRGFGIEDWIAGKKASGQINQIGFSYHGTQQDFLTLLGAYDWDFCMIQYNYMNENYQAGRKGLLRAHEKGMAVIIMEPLLGGKLAVGLPKKVAKLFRDTDSSLTPAAWALRWLWNQKEVSVVLSGMNSMEQLDDNITTAETAEVGKLTEGEIAAIARASEIFKEAYKVPCTECNYCMPCPKGVNIPGSFAAYNASHVAGFITGMSLYVTSTGLTDPIRNASGKKCVKCGICEEKCPQNIEIIKSLGMVLKRMEPFWFSIAISAVRKFMNKK